MPTALRDVLRDNLRFCRRRLLVAVEALGPEDLSHQPVPTLMSPRRQLVHVAEAEHGWRSRCTGEPPPEAGPAEALSIGPLCELLAEQREITEAWLETLTDDDLATPVTDADGRELTVAWVLCHLARHDAHHAGQILGLWRIRHPEARVLSGYAHIIATQA